MKLCLTLIKLQQLLRCSALANGDGTIEHYSLIHSFKDNLVEVTDGAFKLSLRQAIRSSMKDKLNNCLYAGVIALYLK
ncbi:MAG: hypothetical protein H6619_04795 [Deltaproteobacteria bacterium]|nr:hypothetical protein [Deltaproteobacteria bacterium]